jgi:hypothetical protein
MCHQQEPSILDLISQISSIIIASFSLLFAIYIFVFQNKKDDKKDENSRKIDSLKTIIFEHNLNWLFDYFDQIVIKTEALKVNAFSDLEKEELNDKLQDDLKKLRLKFTDLLLVVDKSLYEKVKDLLDELLDKITNNMFDDGINLQHPPKFEEVITTNISQYKTDIIRELYEFNGK